MKLLTYMIEFNVVNYSIIFLILNDIDKFT